MEKCNEKDLLQTNSTIFIEALILINKEVTRVETLEY